MKRPTILLFAGQNIDSVGPLHHSRTGSISAAEHDARRRWVLLNKRTSEKSRLSTNSASADEFDGLGSPLVCYFEGALWLHVEPIEAAHVAGRIDAGEMHGAHAQSLEIVHGITL